MGGGNKAVKVTKQQAGEINVEVVESDVPQPGSGQVLVRIQCRPINPADVLSLQGLYPGFKPASLPATPGLEGMGVVEQSAAGCSKFRQGQRVTWAGSGAAGAGNGSWQQFCCIDEAFLYAVPDKLSDETAAQFFVNPCTAYGMLAVLAAPKGEWVLQNAAGSVLGRQLTQIARHQDVKTINLVRRREQVQELKDAGDADEVLCTEDEDWVDKVKHITDGKGAYGAVDAVAGELTAKMVNAVRKDGTVLIYGALSGFTATVPVPDVLFQGKIVKGFLLRPWIASFGGKHRPVLEDVMGLLEQGVIRPFSGKSFPLDQVREAVDEARKPARGGKAFLVG